MINKMFNFNQNILTKIKPPKEKRENYKDLKETGLLLIVSYGGSKVFYLGKEVDKKYQRIKIGNFPNVSIEEARKQAKQLKAQVANSSKKITLSEENYDHNNSELSEKITFIELYNKYINDYAMYNTKSWQLDIKEIDNNAKHLYNKEIYSITRNDIQQIFNNITLRGKYGANRFLDRLKAIFNKAIKWGLIEKSPTQGIKKHKEKTRDRYLTVEEMRNLRKVLEEEPNKTIVDFIYLALYTAARKSNLLSMSWDNIDWINKTWYIPDTKNGDPHILPLSDLAIEILKRRRNLSNNKWVFPSSNSKTGHLVEIKKAWQRVIEKAGIKNFRIHDLRRTKGSWMAIEGASQYIIGKALNHKSPRSTQIYARVSLNPVREYMEKIDNLFNVL